MSGRSLNTALSRRAPELREPDALTVREVDGLVSKLLSEVRIPFPSLGKRVLNHLADLKKVLSTDYVEGAKIPSKDMLKELSHVVEKEIKSRSYTSLWRQWDSPDLLPRLTKIFGSREIEVKAEPYTEGAGLALRGFFCRASVGEKRKFVIFLNTAHHPGAVVATFGHELGHYIYGSLVGEKAPMAAFLEGTFSNHLVQEDELFADSLVAFSAYDRELIKQIGPLYRVTPGSSEELFSRIRNAYAMIGNRFNLDLSSGKMGNVWRVRYLTSMTHFFKLRCALYASSGL
jgi:hypothetical protein